MKKLSLVLLLLTGMLSVASAKIVYNQDFSGLFEGNLAGQDNWWESEPFTYAFYVTTNSTADTLPYESVWTPMDGAYIIRDGYMSNNVDDEYTYTIDFRLKTTPYTNEGGWWVTNVTSGGVTNIANAAKMDHLFQVYDVGLTSGTDWLQQASHEDCVVIVRTTAGGVIEAGFDTHKDGVLGHTMCSLTDADANWDPRFRDTNASAPDFETDWIRLQFTMRKTRNDGIYKGYDGSFSNLNNGVVSAPTDPGTQTWKANTNLYDADGSDVRLAMGHNEYAGRRTEPYSLIHIEIDEMVVNYSNVPPRMGQAQPIAFPGHQQVVLTWDTVPDAQWYAASVSTSSNGVYTQFATNLTECVATNTGLIGGNIYWYKVTCCAAGALDTHSVPIPAEPIGPPVLPIDTDFTTSDGYVNGDIVTANANRWKTVLASEPHAFYITDAAGSGYASTIPYTNYFNSGWRTNQDVYLDIHLSNNVADEWYGSKTFVLSVDPQDGLMKTNIVTVTDGTNTYGYVTNIANIAGNGNDGAVLSWGLKAPEWLHGVIWTAGTKGGQYIALMQLKVRDTGDLKLNWGGNQLLTNDIPFDAIGWNPKLANPTNAPDFESATNTVDFVSDPITVNWRIRRSLDWIYTASATVSVGTNTVGASDIGVGNDIPFGVWSNTMGYCFFFLSHSGEADDPEDGRDDQGTDPCNPIQVEIDSLSLSHSNNVPPTMFAPGNLQAEAGDHSALLTWDTSWDATDYSILRATSINGPYGIVASNITGLIYTNGGLVNHTTYLYKIVANYPELPYGQQAVTSEWVHVTPVIIETKAQWGLTYDVVTAHQTGDFGKTTQTNCTNYAGNPGEIENWYGIGTDPVGAAFHHELGGGGLYTTSSIAPALYANLQWFLPDTAPGYKDWDRRVRDDSSGDYISFRATSLSAEGQQSQVVYVQKKNAATIDLTTGKIATMEYDIIWQQVAAVHAVIGDASGWYMSSNSTINTGAFVVDVTSTDTKWAQFTMPDTDSTNMLSVSNLTFNTLAVSAFSDVRYAGYFLEGVSNQNGARVRMIKLIVSEPYPTAYLRWAAQYYLFNDDADPNWDFDGDGAVNFNEWALGGDPTNAVDAGMSPKTPYIDDSGNLIYIYPRMNVSNPYDRPIYGLEETDDLVFGSWTYQGTRFQTAVDIGGWSTNNSDWDAVTNAIPTTNNTMMIHLKIEVPHSLPPPP